MPGVRCEALGVRRGRGWSVEDPVPAQEHGDEQTCPCCHAVNAIIRCGPAPPPGTKADRPAFAEMLAEVLNDGVRMIIAESMDRFARDLGGQIALLAKLRSDGIALISATTGEDVAASLDEDPMKEAMVLIQGVFAQAEKKRLVLKLRKAREAKRGREGRCEGRKPYGQTEEERRIIATIKKLRRKPKKGKARGYQAIADILNANGLPARRGGQSYASTVRAVCGGAAFPAARVGEGLSVGH